MALAKHSSGTGAMVNQGNERLSVVDCGLSRSFLRFSAVKDKWHEWYQTVTPDKVERVKDDSDTEMGEHSGPIRYTFLIRCTGTRYVDVSRRLKFDPPQEFIEHNIEMRSDVRLWPGDVLKIVVEDRQPDIRLVGRGYGGVFGAIADRLAVIAAEAALENDQDGTTDDASEPAEVSS